MYCSMHSAVCSAQCEVCLDKKPRSDWCTIVATISDLMWATLTLGLSKVPHNHEVQGGGDKNTLFAFQKLKDEI